MRSWRSKPFCINLSTSISNHGQTRRTFRIKKYLGRTSKDAEKTAARYKHKHSTVEPKLPIASEEPLVQEETTQDLMRKVLFGGREDTDHNIAAYEQRHQKFLEVLKGDKSRIDSGEVIERHGGKDASQKRTNRHRKEVNVGAETGNKKDEDQKSRRWKSFFAQTTSLAEDRQPPTVPRIRRIIRSEGSDGDQPGRSETKPNGNSGAPNHSDTQSEHAGRANLWSRLSSRTASQLEDRSEFDSVVADDTKGAFNKKEKDTRNRSKRRPSLFEELFPEEASASKSGKANLESHGKDIPKLSLPELDEDDTFEDEYTRSRISEVEKSRAASKEGFRLWNPSVLVLQVASPSLIDDDFRRIAPKGQHIDEWTGPGDYFKGNISPSAQHMPFALTILAQ